MSVLWYWGTKRKVEALDSMKLLLGDLFKLTGLGDDGCVSSPSLLAIAIWRDVSIPHACLFPWLQLLWHSDGRQIGCMQFKHDCSRCIAF